ncbi:MAG: hypothetical protein JXA64_04400 [Candidatus Fermentibacteraceae bacterium]|nr:hypothetical protein [Candidatus Fermentibacteraceae bacterium]MBN2608334.1 hypothetical protein [Candidatus Fermentibacteraceae bacterium]
MTAAGYMAAFLFLCVTESAAQDERMSGVVDGTPDMSSSADIDLILMRDWVIDETDIAMGLDVWADGPEIRVIFCDQIAGVLGSFDPGTGVVVGELPLCPSNSDCFGVTFDSDPADQVWYTNDENDACLYYTEDLSNWYTIANPSLQHGRGMDFDGAWYWETFGDSGVYRFQPGGSQELIDLPGIPDTLSGLTVFPLGSNLGIAATCFESENLFFYEWDGVTATCLGAAACPSAVKDSCNYGLAYCEQNEMLYWSYISASDEVKIAEISFEINTVLEQSSWGGIKSVFGDL